MAPSRPPTFQETRHQVTSTMSKLQILDADNPPSTDANKPNITTLPNELLMPIARHLAFDKAEAHLDSSSFQGYIQCQKDLRSLCLVSKQMDAVARQYLFRAVIVKNSDILVYLARTLDASPGLGHLVKQIAFEVPFDYEDARYRKPYVGVLGSRPNYSKLCQKAVEALDAAKYEEFQLDFPENTGFESTFTFRDWAWSEECDILRQLHCDVFLRLSNVERLCFGMLGSFQTRDTVEACSEVLTNGSSWRVDGPVPVPQPLPGFQSKLRHLQLLGDSPDGEMSSFGFYMTNFLQIPTLQTLECVRDDGDMYYLSPHQDFSILDAPSAPWEWKNITVIDFQQSRCTPAAIFQLSATFPCLERFSISVERGTAAKTWSDKHVEGFGTKEFLSTGLGKLEHLRELNLDLHYEHNIKPFLGEHGLLSLGGLNELTNVRLPLHCIVEVKTGNEPRLGVADLAAVFPPSVKHLTVWAGLDCVRNWDKGPSTSKRFAGPPPVPGLPYYPRDSALDFMYSVCGLLTSHFKHLKEATYCYGGQALDTACQCDSDAFCSRCEAFELLDLQATDDSATRMGTLASISEARGVSLRTLQEKIEE